MSNARIKHPGRIERMATIAAALCALALAAALALAKSAPPPEGPPMPMLLSHPASPTSDTSASFTFTDSTRGVAFQCKLDRGAYKACSSPTSFTGLGLGRHEFDVRAVDNAGDVSSPAEYDWRITSQQAALPFTVEGSAPSALYPGAAPRAVPVKLINPNHAPIFVTSLTVALQSSALPTGCGASNFQIVQPNISSATAVEVPAEGSVTLPAQGVSSPTIQMLETHVNQSACERATVWLSYTGSAHS